MSFSVVPTSFSEDCRFAKVITDENNCPAILIGSVVFKLEGRGKDYTHAFVTALRASASGLSAESAAYSFNKAPAE